jgi:hypothetical protein
MSRIISNSKKSRTALRRATRKTRVPAAAVWTRLRPREKQTLEDLSRRTGLPQTRLLGLAVRRWLIEHATAWRRAVFIIPVSTAADDDSRNVIAWARLGVADKRELADAAAAMEHSPSGLVRQAFLWWVQH